MRGISFVGLFYSLLVFASSAAAEHRSAVRYLADVQDQYHRAFDVYTDLDAAGNHFAVRARMSSYDLLHDGAAAAKTVPAMDEGYTLKPHSGSTCIKASFRSEVVNGEFDWGGWYFMNGVSRRPGQTEGEPNWGHEIDAGVDLRGARRLTFWARGDRGGERVEFFALGIGWNPDETDPATGVPRLRRDPSTGNAFAHPDSSPKAGTGFVTLSPAWKQYSIDLRKRNLSYVLGGFGWATNAVVNGMRDVTFYLDDVRYELDDGASQHRLATPRFLVSYETSGVADFDRVMRNSAHTYDNALALLAFLAAGETGRAGMIANALVEAQAHDRFPPYQGSLRNAYQGGELFAPPGWAPPGHQSSVRLPGWMGIDGSAGKVRWLEDSYSVSRDAGNMAWAILGLLAYHEMAAKEGDRRYLAAAERIGGWIARNCTSSDEIGYTGGYNGWEPKPEPAKYQATEHNIDLYVAFQRLYRITGDSIWRERADRALRFVRKMWDADEGMFWTGTNELGKTNKEVIPLDIQAWAVLALGEESALSSADQQRALQYVDDHMYLARRGYAYSRRACDANGEGCRDREGVWYEGTSQMAVAYRHVGNTARAREITALVEVAQQPSGAVPAADQQEGLLTGFARGDQLLRYFRRSHVGATAWLVFAETGVNPYWLGSRTRK